MPGSTAACLLCNILRPGSPVENSDWQSVDWKNHPGRRGTVTYHLCPDCAPAPHLSTDARRHAYKTIFHKIMGG